MAIHKIDNKNTTLNGVLKQNNNILVSSLRGTISIPAPIRTLTTTYCGYILRVEIKIDPTNDLVLGSFPFFVVNEISRDVYLGDTGLFENTEFIFALSPWRQSGLYYDDGTTKVIWDRSVRFEGNSIGSPEKHLVLETKIRLLTGTLAVDESGALQYQMINSMSAGGDSTGGGGMGGAMGKYFYKDTFVYKGDDLVDSSSTITDFGDISVLGNFPRIGLS